MKLSAILKPMLDAKADPAAIMALVLAYEAEADAGKEKARARWRNWKERNPTNVGKRLPTRTNVSKQLAHTEDLTSTSEIEPQEKKVPVKRALRLPEDWTLPVDWRADALKAGLPEQFINLEAEKMRDWSRSAPKGAKTEWRPAWRNWCREAAGRLGNQRAGPGGRPAKPDHFKDYARELSDGQERDDRGGSSHWDDAQGFPLRTIEHH